MEELECSRSTLHRTVVHLRDVLGAPVINSPGRGYLYDRSAGKFELPGLWFRADELEALLVMDHLLESVQPGLLHEHMQPLRNKVRDLLDRGSPGRDPFPTHRIRILRSHARQVATPKLVTVATAVVERRQLSFAYSGRVTGGTSHRRASPQRLVYYRDQWYLDAWDEDKDALRTFSIDRMADIQVLEGDARAREVGEILRHGPDVEVVGRGHWWRSYGIGWIPGRWRVPFGWAVGRNSPKQRPVGWSRRAYGTRPRPYLRRTQARWHETDRAEHPQRSPEPPRKSRPPQRRRVRCRWSPPRRGRRCPIERQQCIRSNAYLIQGCQVLAGKYVWATDDQSSTATNSPSPKCEE